MYNANKVSSKYKLASSVALSFTILTVQSKNNVHLYNAFHNNLTALHDTIKPGKKITLPDLSSSNNADTFPLLAESIAGRQRRLAP